MRDGSGDKRRQVERKPVVGEVQQHVVVFGQLAGAPPHAVEDRVGGHHDGRGAAAELGAELELAVDGNDV